MHEVKGLVNVVNLHVVRDVFVDLQAAVHVLVNEGGDLVNEVGVFLKKKKRIYWEFSQQRYNHIICFSSPFFSFSSIFYAFNVLSII